MPLSLYTRASACLFAITLTTPALACSSCGCNIASDWLTQGLIAHPGTSISLRYDYVPQTQLRVGHDVVDRAAIAFPVDDEIERYSYNHYLTVAVDHGINDKWAINVQLPLILRPHRTVTEGETEDSTSRTKGIGDLRLTARYQGFGGPGITGIQFGLKLPTGQFRQRFRTGPEAGNLVDRGLQPGSGTTDAILGAYHFGRLSGAFDYVLQAQGQLALTNRDRYRPGAAATFSAGLSYTGWRGITPQLQLNLRVAGKDRGANADTPNSGGEQLYIAPGLSVPLGPQVQAFGIVQLPVYQRVNGFQLAPRVTVSLGLQYRL
jgi:hypothetical protein